MRTPIENQTQIPKDQWRYGLRASSKVGCGWISVYNALITLGESPLPETVIGALERQLPLVHGTFGTSVQRFDAMCRASDAAILFYYWRRKHRFGAHFVALEARPDGFWGYNTYSNSQGPDYYGESLSEYLLDRRYFGCVLTCIRKKS